MNSPEPNNPGRRSFMSMVTKAVSSTIVLTNADIHAQPKQGHTWTVGEVMDLFIKQVPGGSLAQTVDTLKSGSRDTRVTGIVTTMFATVDVIRKAVAVNANLIIAHEPTFYNHLDDTSWLATDAVYQYKAGLLKQHNIAVWRNHDYIHSLTSDGVDAGVVKQLEWEPLAGANPSIFNLPPTRFSNLIEHVKAKLGIDTVRYIGDLSETCEKVLLMPGASGGRSQIASIGREKPDVIICGEVAEWETAEYVRDARSKGDKLSLVILGHVASEEPGSKFLADWCKQHIKGVTTTHVPAGNSLQFY